MTQSRLIFKRALKQCRKQNDQIVDNKIAMNLKGNSKKLWSEIDKKKNSKTKLSDVIDGATGGEAICELWKNHFLGLFNDESHPSPSSLPRHVVATAPIITVQDVKRAMKSLNMSSSQGHDGLTPQHVSCSHPVIYIMLSLLFTVCTGHSLLPDDLLKVIISPIVKDKNGDLCSKDNYRPIAVSTVFSKILELILLYRCSEYLMTSNNQFAYKENHGTDMPVALLKNVALEYTKRNTPIYACFFRYVKGF